MQQANDGYSLRKLDASDRAQILQQIDAFSEQAYRVLAIAYRPLQGELNASSLHVC